MKAAFHIIGSREYVKPTFHIIGSRESCETVLSDILLGGFYDTQKFHSLLTLFL